MVGRQSQARNSREAWGEFRFGGQVFVHRVVPVDGDEGATGCESGDRGAQQIVQSRDVEVVEKLGEEVEGTLRPLIGEGALLNRHMRLSGGAVGRSVGGGGDAVTHEQRVAPIGEPQIDEGPLTEARAGGARAERFGPWGRFCASGPCVGQLGG